MFQTLKVLYQLLTPNQRSSFFKLQVLVVITSIIEIASLLTIVPFMVVVRDLPNLSENSVFSELYRMSKLNNPYDFLLLIGCVVLVAMILSALLSIVSTWRLSLFSHSLGEEMSQRLYNFYLYQSWPFHTSTNSSYLVKKISQETQRVTKNIIQPFFSLNARLVTVFFMLIVLLFYDFKVALSCAFVFLTIYFIIYSVIRKKILVNGHQISDMTTVRFKLMQESFGGIKDLLVLNRQHFFSKQFSETSLALAKSEGGNATLRGLPRYIIELAAFGSILSLILYLLSINDGGLDSFLPVLGIYALATLKILPAFQQIYASVTNIKGNLHAFESIREDLEKSYHESDGGYPVTGVDSDEKTKLLFNKSIKIDGVTVTHSGKNIPTLVDIYLEFPAHKTIALVGASGSGKSTIIDVLLGLITPQKGCLKVDEVEVNSEGLISWQRNIGYVSQSIFLANSSIYENIAFGLPKAEIDMERVLLVARMSHIDDFVSQLPEGYSTLVGERGIKLSGGQMQRVGIARALYTDADFLIFDEATSSLDSLSEKVIMNAIYELGGEKTIVIVAHKFKTIEKCDFIYLLGDDGSILDCGSYSELISRSVFFNELSE